MGYWGYAILGAVWGSALYWLTVGSKNKDQRKALSKTLSLFVVSAIPGPIISSIGCELLLYHYEWLRKITTLPQFIAFVSGWVGHKVLLTFGEKGIDFAGAFSESFFSSFRPKTQDKGENNE